MIRVERYCFTSNMILNEDCKDSDNFYGLSGVDTTFSFVNGTPVQ